MENQIRVANKSDIELVKEFLGKSEVSVDGVEAIIDHFIVMEDNDKEIVATLGIERIEKDGLLRSLVISPRIDQSQLLTLFKSVISLAKHKEMKDLYLATNKNASAAFFELLGFQHVNRNEIADYIIESNHIKRLVNSDPIMMKTQLS